MNLTAKGGRPWGHRAPAGGVATVGRDTARNGRAMMPLAVTGLAQRDPRSHGIWQGALFRKGDEVFDSHQTHRAANLERGCAKMGQ